MTHRTTTLLSIIGAIVLCLSLLAYGGTLYLMETYKRTLVERMQDEARAKANQEFLTELVRLVDTTQTQREELETRIINDVDVIELLALIETIGREQGIVLATESLTTEPLNEAFEHLRIQLGAKGSYEGIMYVLTMLETLPYQSAIDSVSVTSDSEDMWTASIELIVTKYVKA
jgi:hypothetical protein